MLSRREMLALSATVVGTTGLRPPLAWAWVFPDEDPTRVFTGELKPTDFRLGAAKTLNDYFPFSVPKTKEAWEARRKQLREQLLVATGLWPMPEKTPLNAVVHGQIDKGTYTIEKVFFASMPGHYVSGNLYRPADRLDSTKPRKYPACCSRTVTGPTAGFTTPARRPRRRASMRRASRTWIVAGTSCRRFPRRSRHSASSSSTTTWSASPTAPRFRTRRASPMSKANSACRARWACRRGTASVRSTSSPACRTWTRSASA